MSVRRLYIDCDGVLTDGKLTIDRNGGKMFKSFHTRDVRAIRELISEGIEVTIVTADEWAGIYRFAEKVGADVLIRRDKSDLPQPYMAVGDDAWDIPMLKRAVFAYCPADADQAVLDLPGIMVITKRGGEGVIAALLQFILANDE